MLAVFRVMVERTLWFRGCAIMRSPAAFRARLSPMIRAA
jgi:hypothetical protein